jgi:hypothetical protein
VFFKSTVSSKKFSEGYGAKKKHTDAVRMKAKEQQEQQKAEKTVEVNIPQQPSAGNVIEPNSQQLPYNKKRRRSNRKTAQTLKKPVTTQQVPTKAAQY